MKENQDTAPSATTSQSISKLAIAKFITKLVSNQPKKAFQISKLWLSGSNELGVYLGQELIEVLKALEPNVRTIVDTLTATKQAITIDDLFETINPLLNDLLEKKIGTYGVSLKDLDLHTILTETYIKNDLLPIFLTLRDIPKVCKSIKEKNFLQVVQATRAQLLTHLETDLHSEIRKHLVIGTDGVYEIKPTDPALVSQIKKVLNAFAYAEKVIEFVNSMDINPDKGLGLEALLAQKEEHPVEYLTKAIWYLAMKDSVVGNYLHFSLDLEPEELRFIHEIEQAILFVRKAQSSLLEVDIPTFQIFESELKTLDALLGSLQKITTGETTTLWQDKLSSSEQIAQTVSDYVGKPLGAFIEQLKPSPGNKDFSFFTTQLGLLPGYLDELTQLIYIYGVDKPDKALALSESETEVFKDSAIKLFFELSNLDNLFFWQKSYSFLFPIRIGAVTLSQGTYQQITRVNEATGEMIAYQLSRLKKELFTKMISESDKLELYLGLAPGVLTKPLMLKLNDLYQTLVLYANSVIDLKETHPDLLQLDNTSFLTKRLQDTLQEKNESQLKLERAKKAKHDLKQFTKHFLSSITEEEKAALKALYQSFKPYVIEYNPRLSVQLDDYFASSDASSTWESFQVNLIAMSQAVESLCNKDLATFGCYLNLAEHRLTELPKQVKGKLYPLSPSNQHSFLKINEYGWLVEARVLTHESNAEQNQELQFIDDLTALTPENRAELYDYHSIRVLTLKHIQQQISVFLEQLAEADWATNTKSIHTIIERYRVLQPYFVDSIVNTVNKDTDASFVELLNQLSNEAVTPKKFIVILDAVNASMKELNQHIAREVKNSENRQPIFEIAHRQVREKKLVYFDDAPLNLDSELVQRQDKWIRHQQLSRSATDMKKVLLQLLTQFDPCLKLSAPAPSNSAPFPEMEQDLEALATPAQVSWAKRMLNVVHYIDSNFKYLESLDRDVSKKDVTHYFLKGPLIDGLYQVKPFVELAKAYQTLMELMQEPTGQLLSDTLSSAYGNLIGAWDIVKPLYFIPSDQVEAAKPKPVESSGLWYPLMALMVLPEHLEYASAGNSYTALDAEIAQKKAKEMALYIEEVTEEFQASQYFNLLMKSPYILFTLMPQLKAQLERLRATTNQTTVTHLQEIQTTLQSILIETDVLEAKFGLRVGIISKPTKLIINKLFNSFIEPLSISLQESTQLVQNISSFQDRARVNRQKQREVMGMLESEKTLFHTLDQFLQSLQTIKTKLETAQIISTSEKEEFNTLYWSVYPLLQSQQSHYQISLDQRDKSEVLDAFCNECLNQQLQAVASSDQVYHYTALKDIMYLTLHVHAAKKGNINSLEMRSSYLNAQSQSIALGKQQFVKTEVKEAVEHCINSTFDNQVELLCKKTNQLVYLEAQYKSILRKNLLSKKEEVLEKVGTTPLKDLEDAISSELQKQFKFFCHKEYLQLMHLDSILNKIEHFQSYCQKEKLKPTYESIDPVIGTLRPKIELLNKLKDLAQNDQESPEKRIIKLKAEAQKDTFYTILMSHENHFKFELKTLKRMFLNLFHTIFNYFGMTYRPADFYTSLDATMKSESPSFANSALLSSSFFAEGREKLTDNSHAALEISEQLKKPGVP